MGPEEIIGGFFGALSGEELTSLGANLREAAHSYEANWGVSEGPPRQRAEIICTTERN